MSLIVPGRLKKVYLLNDICDRLDLPFGRTWLAMYPKSNLDLIITQPADVPSAHVCTTGARYDCSSS